MMSRHIAATILFTGIALASAACAVRGRSADESDDVTIRRGAISGTIQRTDFFYSVNPDCTLEGLPIVKLKQAPDHGTVAIEQGTDYPQFSPGNQRYECNKSKSPGIIVSYTSKPGFKGQDAFVLEALYPHGRLRFVSVQMTVE